MLQGVRVVELATLVAVPTAAAVLADLGAEVIKIESKDGDALRRQAQPGEEHSPLFTNCNRGKKSVVLNVRDTEDLKLLHALIDTADIFMTSERAPELRGLGLDFDTVHRRHKRLVYAHLTPWGQSGPRSDRRGDDVGVWWAATGLMDMLRTSDAAGPPRLLPGMGDLVTSQQIVAGISLALVYQQRTGEGQLVDACSLRSGLFVNGCLLTMQARAEAKLGVQGWTLETSRKNPMRADRTGTFNPCVNNYRTVDNKFVMLMGLELPRHMPTVLKILGLEHLIPDMKGLPGNRKMFIAEMDKAFAKVKFDDICATFDREGVWYTPVKKYEDMVEDVQAGACGAFVNVPGVDHKVLATPIKFSEFSAVPRAPAPSLGQQTSQVLEALQSKL